VVVGVLTLSSGYSPEYLLKEIAAGRENYYTGAVTDGEPPGRWWGAGAEALGLTGLVDAQDMRAVYERYLDPRDEAFADPARWDEATTLGHTGRRYTTEDELYAAAVEREPDASAERRAEFRVEAGKQARHNVAFHDATFSVQKSVTLLHTAFEAEQVKAERAGDTDAAAAWAEHRRAVEDAIWAGNHVALAYMSEKAGYVRVGHHGGAAGRWEDAHDWVVASFFQHDSRDHDPQLHVHNTILNRVESPDGTWRTLDGRSLYRWRPAAAAVGERTLEEHLTRSLGVRFATRPDGKAREVVGVSPEAMDLISSRRHAVTAKAAQLIEAFEQRHDREPTSAERDRLARQATFATRRAKSHDGETREQVLDRVEAQLAADIAGGLGEVADAALAARPAAPASETWSPRAVIELALAEVQSRKAGWTRADLVRALNQALPDTLGLPEGTDLAALLDSLADQAVILATPLESARPGEHVLPGELRLINGESAYRAPGGQVYATPAHVRSENILRAATGDHTAAAVSPAVAARFLEDLRESGLELGVDQAAAVRGVLTSGAAVETLVGPAGTGKSFVVGTLAKAWTDPGLRGAGAGRVFGLATSQVATQVLADEGLTTRNVSRWLATQDRLVNSPGNSHDDDRGWRLRKGDLVVVDESAMADTAALAAIHQHTETAGAKLLLVGDHRQLAAVGAGGAMDLLAQAGGRYELADTHRFHHPWEGPASLRLREGDETVLQTYHQHGRLLDAGTLQDAETSAARAWLADTLAGRRSVLVVDTNQQAERLSAQLRTQLVALGRVDEAGVPLGRDGTTAGVGDLVAARRNGWELAGHEGNRRGPINRETYRVTATGDDGSLTVAPVHGRDATGTEVLGETMVLAADYVAADVSLAYAGTVHSTQGTTVDTSHLVASRSTSRAAGYVGLTRGRDANTAHVATITGPADPANGTTAHQLHRDPVAVLAGVITADDSAEGRSALATAAESATEAESTRTAAELFTDAAQLAATHRTAGWLDQLSADGILDPTDRIRIAAEDGAAALTRILRRAETAGHEPRRVLHDAIADRSLDGARSLTNVIHGRIRDDYQDCLDPVGSSWADWTPHTGIDDWDRYLASLAEAADQRANQLGRELADDPPSWLTAAIGEVPQEPEEQDTWREKAATLAAWRESHAHDDPEDALGPAPAPGQVEAFAAYRAAWRALGRPEIDREELELSDGQLRVRVRAHDREAAWAPRYVGNELAGTHQAAAEHRRTEHLRHAEVNAATDETERARNTSEAEQAGALAETLEQRVDQLGELDDARSRWLAHTAGTRAAAERAKAELAARHADDTDPEPKVTAAEWLAAHRAAVAEDERHREVTDADVSDPAHQQVDDRVGERPTESSDERVGGDGATDALDVDASDVHDRHDEETVPEQPEQDIREVVADEPRAEAEDDVRVPSADETAAAVDRAQRAIAEIRARDTADAAEQEHRAEQLTQWHERDEVAEEPVHDDGDVDQPEPVGMDQL
jgi:conjugative relaxase-like TrwC/TraI family protein